MTPKLQPQATSSTQPALYMDVLPSILNITPLELESQIASLTPSEQSKLVIEYRESIKSLSDDDRIRFYDNGGMQLLNILATVVKSLPKKNTNTPAHSPDHQPSIIALNPHTILSARSSTPTKAGIYRWDNFVTKILPLVQNQDKQVQIPNTPKLETLKTNTTGKDMLTKILNIKDVNNLTPEDESKLWTIEEISYFINNQSDIKDKDTNTPLNTTPLAVDSNYNIFPIKLLDGSIALVGAYWRSGSRGWHLGASGLSDGWDAGNHLVVRN